MSRFTGICLVTQDVGRLCDFYQDVLQVEAKGDEVFTAVATQGAELSLFVESGMEQMAPGSMTGAGSGGYTLEFEVEDVDAEYARLTKMDVPIVKPPTTQPWGRRSVWFRDPDGNLVNFYATVANNQKPVEMKTLIRQYFQRLLNEKDLTVCDEMLASEYIDHDAPSDTPPGPQSIKEFVKGFLEEYPDMHVAVEDLVVEGNQAAARLLWQGHQRESGKVSRQAWIIFLRLNDAGQLVERWSAYETLQ